MNKNSKSYAKSLFEIITHKENIKENLNLSLENLLVFSAAIENSKNLFQSPLISEKLKYEALVSLFPKITKVSHSLLKLLVEKREISLLPEIYLEFEKLNKNYFASKQVKLITTSYLDKELSIKIIENLKKIIQAKEIILDVEYKEELLSGLIIEFNSWALDKSSLQEVKSLLKSV